MWSYSFLRHTCDGNPAGTPFLIRRHRRTRREIVENLGNGERSHSLRDDGASARVFAIDSIHWLAVGARRWFRAKDEFSELEVDASRTRGGCWIRGEFALE